MNTRTSALESTIFGVDVQSGDVRGDAPSYALVVLDDEGIERDVVTGRKLRRRIESEAPAIVATDNMYELAENKDALIHFLGELPHETRLVQVTGDEQPEPLSRVAKRHGVPYGKDPMQEAEASARLAAANVGFEVAAFEDTTAVKVSRGRSTGKGGWSEDRYTRRIHGSVKRRAREVESSLEDADLPFEVDVTEKYGGYANAVFTVQARPEDIPVTTGRSGDVRVEMERERTDGIEFRPLAKRRDPVVVGVDPGTTTAVAIVGLDGRLLDVTSSRTVDAAGVIEWIIERGRPMIVAADVTPMPETVEKLRRSFEAAGWTPDSDLPVDEKLHRTREVPSDDDHQRDAAAAALSAYDDHADQFERVAAKTPADTDLGTVLGRVLVEETSVEAVLDALEGNSEEAGAAGTEGGAAADNEPSPEQRRIRQLESQVERLEEHVETLTGTIAEKDDRVEDLEAELRDARREERREARERQVVQRLERETDRLERERDEAREAVEELEGKLERLKALWRLDHSNFADVAETRAGLVPVKVIEQFTTDAIDDAQERFGLAPDDVIMLRDASGAGRSTAERLAAIEPRVVLRNGNLSDVADEVLFDADVPVAPADLVTVQEVDELAVARESEIEDAIADWEERAAERERARNAELVDQVISEHRAERPSDT